MIATLAALVEDLAKLWERTLFTVGDKEVRVSQVMIALAVILVGLGVSRIFTRVLRGRLEKRTRLDDSAAIAVEKVLFYILAAVIVLVGMQIVGIPITAFTVLGGAFAIGVGFGAQNLINNFISGLILLFERPVRIGDIIEVDDELGEVRGIATRCTYVRRNDGADVLIPNSTLLENKVFNWTRRDRRIRATVSVGVAYGSPTDKVRDLMLQAVREDDRALKSPGPLVLFQEFGDNALRFEVFFWAEIRVVMDLRRLQSDLRFRIDELFRQHEITISFPQRDVHLDSLSPIEVHLQREDGARRGRIARP